ncbi:MAG TPA: gluconate 2-dehydrogenase subunit 3 family protein [Candidatus Dormibacteraeota bacterium]|nr:gluconate 2-dehydrogenase subunit 3 family protein [Candidatus Dormibacteraeota bacterium]
MKDASRKLKVSRRGFLASGAAAIVTVAVSGATMLVDPHGTFAIELDTLTPAQARVLLQFVRDLFPHSQIAEKYYAQAIVPLNDEAAKNLSAKKLLVSGIAQLNRLAKAAPGKTYADVADENVRVAAIKQIEQGPFFAKVYGTTVVSFYNQRALWPIFGYQGPSSAQSGYLHRGFNDLDWL